MVIDPISNYIIKLKNATLSKKETVSVPFSNLKYNITNVLEKEGFVKNLTKKGAPVTKDIQIGLVYKSGTPAIQGVQRLSTLAKKIYAGANGLVPVKSGRGAVIVSTSQGVMTDKQARKLGIGGELLFKIW